MVHEHKINCSVRDGIPRHMQPRRTTDNRPNAGEKIVARVYKYLYKRAIFNIFLTYAFFRNCSTDFYLYGEFRETPMVHEKCPKIVYLYTCTER